MQISKEILTQTEQYFKEKRNQFGETVRGLDWNSKEAQDIRFSQLTKLFSNEGDQSFSICDYGCGYGDYFGYLQERGYSCKYMGVDIVRETILCAEQKYDYITASGIFNVKRSMDEREWENYVIGILEDFYDHSGKGFAFNCLTKYSDAEYMRADLYYADPLFYFDYAKKHFSRNVALLHDYELYDFTIIVRK